MSEPQPPSVPRPTQAHPTAESYGPEYYREHLGLDKLRRFSVAWWSIRFYSRLAARLLRRSGGHRILEVGCGHGFILALLESRFETYGLDLSSYAVERARAQAPRSRIFRADISSEVPPEIEQQSFDLILARYVLEHIPDPGNALARMASRLSSGGRLLYSVPDSTSPGRRLKKEDWFGYRDETHVSLLPPERWLELTRQSGLSVERRFSDGLWDIPYVRGFPNWVQYGLFSVPTIISVALAWTFIPAGWGENLIVIARRSREPR
ncbi:MAG: class I SAM-dependent methyltransferase [Acidobacteriota bacterium]|nr:MAG: class I SAM-dependent methyltransferase [Acidobacteriota bacterium]